MIYLLPKKCQPLIYKVIQWYYRKPRIISKRGLSFWLLPSVFHPSLYLSTDILLDYILTQHIESASILELGCGNGFISLFLAKYQNVQMYASDINAIAVEGLRQNAQQQQVNISIYHSDLFNNIPREAFDYILINPPYFQKKIAATHEAAFYAGAQLEYFQKGFQQLQFYLKQGTIVIMILSENVPLNKIKRIAEQYSSQLKEVQQIRKKGELFLIYQLVRTK